MISLESKIELFFFLYFHECFPERVDGVEKWLPIYMFADIVTILADRREKPKGLPGADHFIPSPRRNCGNLELKWRTRIEINFVLSQCTV